MASHSNQIAAVAVVGIVDDDPAVRNSLKFSLEVEGFVVDTYANADELLQENGVSRFLCLVVDQNLPGLSGLELASKLRARLIAVPVILITTHPSKALIARAQNAAIPIVEKPLLGNALLEQMRDLIPSGSWPH